MRLMANEDHLALLNQGTTAWNAWRTEHPEIVPDLSKADLHGAELSEAHLWRADLEGAHLWRADLSSADLGPVCDTRACKGLSAHDWYACLGVVSLAILACLIYGRLKF